jgi:putative ABC transport system permease protein
MTVDDETEDMQGEQVQPEYFKVLELQPHNGRLLMPADYDSNEVESAIVISYDLWRRRFGASPDTVGRVVRISETLERPFTIVGVAPPGFHGISDPWTASEFWVPAPVSERRLLDVPPGVGVSFVGLARLSPGVKIRHAEAVLEEQGRRIFGDEPGKQSRLVLFESPRVRLPYSPAATVVPRPLVVAVAVVVVIVLFVAVANVGGVLMVRGLSRTSETAIRRLLGQTGVQSARQMSIEGMLLAGFGGLAGLLLTSWALSVFHAEAPAAYALNASVDWRAVVFAAGCCVLCGALAGLAAARQAARLQIVPLLARESATTTGRMGRRMQQAIVLPQVTLSLALILVAGAYTRALLGVELVEPGYDTSHVVVLSSILRPPSADTQSAPSGGADARGERLRNYYEGLVSRFQQLPGLRAAISSDLPLQDPSDRALSLVAASINKDSSANQQSAMASRVSPSFFRTMGMRILRGRDFDARDTLSSPAVGIMSRMLAEKLWPGQDPIGRQPTISSQSPNARPLSFEVVGVVDEVRPVLEGERHAGSVYLAMSQQRRPTMPFIVASGAVSQSAAEQIKAAVRAADPRAEVYRIQSLDRMVAALLFPRRITTTMLIVAGCIALILASAGVYGVVSHAVARRSKEIGVRRALGARDGEVVWMVIRDGLKVAGIGLILGAVVGYLAVRLASARVLAVPQVDSLLMAGSAAVLLTAVVLASGIPAIRAVGVDPLAVLRRP